MFRLVNFILLLILGSLLSVQITWADTPMIETNVVLLSLKSNETVVDQNPFFEILDKNTYVLIPLKSLCSYLPYDINYDRDTNTVIVKGVNTKRNAIINLNEHTYIVEDSLRWPEQPPVDFNDDFYVSILFLEYLVDIKIDWSSKFQELTISADWFEKKPEMNGRTEGAKKGEPKITYLEGPAYSIGAISYELSWENREDQDGNNSNKESIKLRGDGRAGAWAISVAGEEDYTSEGDNKFDLTLIRGKYNENNQLLILGDADAYFANTLAQQRIRGIFYMKPDDSFPRYLTAYTTISGKADPVDNVKLLVNGKLKSEMIIDEDQSSYKFTNVPLSIKRLNIIRILIQKPSGECLITEKKVAASLRILDKDTGSLMATAGYYKRNEEDQEWTGKLIGFKTQHNISDLLSLDCEAIRIEPLDDNSEKRASYGADTGIAFRLGGSTICTFDWLIGGEEVDLKQGWESSVLYCMEKGYIEGIVFYVDPAITSDDKMKADNGKGYRLLGEIEISDRVSYEAKAEAITALPGMDEYASLKDIDLKMNRKYGRELQNTLSIGIRNEIEEEQDPNIKENLRRIYVEHSIFQKRFSLNNYLAYDDIIFQDSLGNGTKDVFNMKIEYIQLLTNSLLYSIDIEYTGEWGDRDKLRNLFWENELEWVTSKMWAGGDLKLNYSAVDPASLKLDSGELELWSKYFFTDALTLRLNLSRNLTNAQDEYTSAELEINYLMKNDRGKYYGSFEYVSPYQTRHEPQLGYKLGLQRNLANGLEIKLETERLYATLWAEQPERVIRLICGQAIGFANGRVKTIKSTEDNDSFIRGLIYLDENGNGQYDRGEKLLPGIKMSLNGRITFSNEKGDYVYNHVEPGTYQLGFDLRSLLADYTPVTNVKLLKIKENENMWFDFGVTVNGSISGRVFLDTNNNGIYDQEDKPLSWVNLVLDNDKQKAYTGSDGFFYFENIPLGEHTLKVVEETIPKEMMLTREKSFRFSLKETSLDIRDVMIRVVYKFRDTASQ